MLYDRVLLSNSDGNAAEHDLLKDDSVRVRIGHRTRSDELPPSYENLNFYVYLYELFITDYKNNVCMYVCMYVCMHILYSMYVGFVCIA